jgi:hypothetical protein
MAITKVQIISAAIGLLGHKPIQTLSPTDSDDLTLAADEVYDWKLPSALSKTDWRFAIQIAQLSEVTGESVPGDWWDTIWNLPAGYLKTIRVYPQNYAWEIYENLKIYAQWDTSQEVYMEYVFQPDVSRLPYYFIDYFVYELASYLALSNAQKPEYFNVLEQKRNTQLAIASAIDSQNRPQRTQVHFPMLDIVRDEDRDGRY